MTWKNSKRKLTGRPTLNCKQEWGISINKRKTGFEYEKQALEYLQNNGYIIVCTNFYCRRGEIDIIAKDGEYLVFVEVKYRKSLKYGYPQEAVSVNKQKRIIMSAVYYCMKNNIPADTPVRFDVVAVLDKDITLLKNAFELQYKSLLKNNNNYYMIIFKEVVEV